MKTAKEYKKMAYESEANQKWITELEKEIENSCSHGHLFLERQIERCYWIKNDLNVSYLESKGFKVKTYLLSSIFPRSEWVLITWKD